MVELNTKIPLAKYFDGARRCGHVSEQGQCPDAPIVGEERCQAHSSSELAQAIRERIVAQDTSRALRRSWGAPVKPVMPMPSARRRAISKPSLPTPTPASGPLSGKSEAQLLQEIEEAMERHHEKEMQERREFERSVAPGYEPGAPPRMYEPLGTGGHGRPPHRERSGRRASDDEQVYKMIFRGDVTTGEGLIRVAERIGREFAAGKLSQRRFEGLMRWVRLLAALRKHYDAPPIDEPRREAVEPADLTLDADNRPSEERAKELKEAAERRKSRHPRPRVTIAAEKSAAIAPLHSLSQSSGREANSEGRIVVRRSQSEGVNRAAGSATDTEAHTSATGFQPARSHTGKMPGKMPVPPSGSGNRKGGNHKAKPSTKSMRNQQVVGRGCVRNQHPHPHPLSRRKKTGIPRAAATRGNDKKRNRGDERHGGRRHSGWSKTPIARRRRR
jgi:hypothetical protein